jgi:hypothetical protein
MDSISYSYKLGVKEEVVEALRAVFNEVYPDPAYRGHVDVVSEYPSREVTYPLIVVRFQSQEVKNIGIGHYELDASYPGQRVLHWRFQGTISFTVYGETPIDRDKILAGLTNLFAFGADIPEFANFQEDIHDLKFITLTILSDSFTEGTDMAMPPAWNPNSNQLLFSNSMTFQVFGEFFTEPSTGDLVEIDAVTINPIMDINFEDFPQL